MNPPQNAARRPVVDRTLPRGDTATTNKKAATATAVRALPEVLSDPTSDWSDVREALKAHGRRSSVGGGSMAVATNAGILGAIRDAGAATVEKEDLEPPAVQDAPASGGSNVAEAKSKAAYEDRGKAEADDKLLAVGIHDLPTQSRRNSPSSDPGKKSASSGSSGGSNGSGTARDDESSHLSSASSSASSSSKERRLLPTLRKRNKVLPERRLPRKSSAKAMGSFRGSLRNVLEDEEADMASDDEDDGPKIAASSRPGLTGAGRPSSFRWERWNSMMSMAAQSSASSLSSCDLSASHHSGLHKESVNLMDFGYDPLSRRSLSDSAASLAVQNAAAAAAAECLHSSALSNLVDSDGFLAWGGGSSDFSRAFHKLEGTSKGGDSSGVSSNSNDTGSSDGVKKPKDAPSSEGESFHHSVDSDGFLGWDATRTSKKEATLRNSWRIEDYEHGRAEVDRSRLEGPAKERTLSRRVKRMSLAVAEGFAARRSLTDFAAQAAQMAQEAIRNDDVKHVLLRACSSPLDERSSSAGDGTKDSARAASAGASFSASFVAGAQKDDGPSGGGERDACRPTRIVREDSYKTWF